MRLIDFKKFLNDYTDLTEASVETRVRAVRAAGLLEGKKRGMGSQDLNASELVTILLAAFGSRQATAEEVVRSTKILSAARCLDISGNPSKSAFLGCDTLFELLEKLLDEKGAFANIISIRIYHDAMIAKVMVNRRVYGEVNSDVNLRDDITYGFRAETSPGHYQSPEALRSLTSARYNIELLDGFFLMLYEQRHGPKEGEIIDEVLAGRAGEMPTTVPKRLEMVDTLGLTVENEAHAREYFVERVGKDLADEAFEKWRQQFGL